MKETRKLAQFAGEVTYDSLPQQVIEKAKELVLDQIGCELAGSTLPWSKATYKYVRDNKASREESTVVNYGLRTSVQDAAFANACFGRSIEVDEIDQVSKCHLSSIIVPAALSMGEREMISGKEFIKALVVGYDVASRIASAVITAMTRGFYPTTVAGPFGAAAAASVIMGLNENEILNALGIAASHASGILEFSESGGSVNKLHGGIGAYGGVKAAILAQRGFSGPESVLEGNKGFCRAFSTEYFLEEITKGLGKDFRILGIGFRRYCCCGTQGAALDAISKITSEHNINPKDIQEMIVRAPKTVLRMVGTIVEPKDITSAQYSGRFGIALKLIKGGDSFNKQYINEENLRDPEILSLIGKIKYVLDEDLEKAPPGTNPTKLEIRFLDGTVYEEQVDAPRGLIQNPMTKKERYDKFKEFASMAFPHHKVEEVIETVTRLEELDNIGNLSSSLTAA